MVWPLHGTSVRLLRLFGEAIGLAKNTTIHDRMTLKT